MYCMKALGVVHFKGNWTNVGKQKTTKTKTNKKQQKRETLNTLPLSCLATVGTVGTLLLTPQGHQ